MSKLKAQKGFSLIELLVTIAIIAIIAAIAVPSYQDTIERNRLKETLQLVKSDIQLARGEAIKRSESVTFSTTSGAAGAWCLGSIASTASCDCSVTVSSAAGYCDVKRISGAEYDKTSITTSANFTFEPRRGTTTSTQLTVTTDNHSAQLDINAAGRVLVCGGDLYDAC